MTINEICQWFDAHNMDELAAIGKLNGELIEEQAAMKLSLLAATLAATLSTSGAIRLAMVALTMGFSYGLCAAEERSLEQMVGVADPEGGAR